VGSEKAVLNGGISFPFAPNTKMPALRLTVCEIPGVFSFERRAGRSFSKKNTPDDYIWGARDGTVSEDALLGGIL